MALLQLEVTHSIIQGALGNKKSFRADVPLHEVKEKLSMIVGTEPRFQKLQLCDPETQAVIMELDDVDLTLNDYGAQRDWILHVIDTDPSRTLEQYTDEAVAKLDKKSPLSDTDYDKKAGTYREWRKDQGLKVRDLNATATSANSTPAKKPKGGDQKPADIAVGQRCEDKTQRRSGTVRFVGQVEFGTGWWVGVEFDQPLGKNDGVRYFSCKTNHGSFFPPAQVAVFNDNDCCGDHGECNTDCEEECGACAPAAPQPHQHAGCTSCGDHS